MPPALVRVTNPFYDDDDKDNLVLNGNYDEMVFKKLYSYILN